jgi:hypothetical protein
VLDRALRVCGGQLAFRSNAFDSLMHCHLD